jgi:hypothetical protein
MILAALIVSCLILPSARKGALCCCTATVCNGVKMQDETICASLGAHLSVCPLIWGQIICRFNTWRSQSFLADAGGRNQKETSESAPGPAHRSILCRRIREQAVTVGQQRDRATLPCRRPFTEKRAPKHIGENWLGSEALGVGLGRGRRGRSKRTRVVLSVEHGARQQKQAACTVLSIQSSPCEDDVFGATFCIVL